MTDLKKNVLDEIRDTCTEVQVKVAVLETKFDTVTKLMYLVLAASAGPEAVKLFVSAAAALSN